MKVPFVMSGSNKNINLFNNDQLDINFTLQNLGLFKIIDKMTNEKDIEFMKGSESKEYYEKLSKNKHNKSKK